MDDYDYEQMQEEAEYLEADATTRRMYEAFEAGRSIGRAEMMCRIYEQEPLVETDKKWQGPLPF